MYMSWLFVKIESVEQYAVINYLKIYEDLMFRRSMRFFVISVALNLIITSQWKRDFVALYESYVLFLLEYLKQQSIECEWI